MGGTKWAPKCDNHFIVSYFIHHSPHGDGRGQTLKASGVGHELKRMSSATRGEDDAKHRRVSKYDLNKIELLTK